MVFDFERERERERELLRGQREKAPSTMNCLFSSLPLKGMPSMAKSGISEKIKDFYKFQGPGNGQRQPNQSEEKDKRKKVGLPKKKIGQVVSIQ